MAEKLIKCGYTINPIYFNKGIQIQAIFSIKHKDMFKKAICERIDELSEQIFNTKPRIKKNNRKKA